MFSILFYKVKKRKRRKGKENLELMKKKVIVKKEKDICLPFLSPERGFF